MFPYSILASPLATGLTVRLTPDFTRSYMETLYIYGIHFLVKMWYNYLIEIQATTAP